MLVLLVESVLLVVVLILMRNFRNDSCGFDRVDLEHNCVFGVVLSRNFISLRFVEAFGQEESLELVLRDRFQSWGNEACLRLDHRCFVG